MPVLCIPRSARFDTRTSVVYDQASMGDLQSHLRHWTTPLMCATALVLLASASLTQAQESPFKLLSTTPSVSARSAAKERLPMQLVTFPTGANQPSNEIATPEVVAWLKRMVYENLPPVYEDDRKWDQQKEVWDGVKIWRENGRLETKRRTKMVNAGTWTKYRVAIVEPEQRVHVQFHRLEPLPTGPIAFGVTIDCDLDVFGRLSQWARDVQVISISANADASCRVVVEGTVEFQMNVLKFPPDVAVKPHVDRAHVELTHYRVRRISQIGGDFAKVLGQGLRNIVDEKLADMNAKLVDKINKQLDKHSDRLRFSPQLWLKNKLPLPAAQ